MPFPPYNFVRTPRCQYWLYGIKKYELWWRPMA